MHRRLASHRKNTFSVFFAAALCLCSFARAAAPSQQDVFRSIQDNVGGGGEVDSSKFLYILLGTGGLVILLCLITTRRKRVAAPRSLNHQKKLTREMMRLIPLKGKELKQLKIVAENASADGPMLSPLTLVLCPSVLARTMQSKRLNVDRKALISVARKAGLQVTKK